VPTKTTYTKQQICHSQFMKWQYQQHLTTNTTHNHEFNHNSTTQYHNSSIWAKFTKYPFLYNLSMQIQQQQLNYHQIHIPKHSTKIRAQISSIKFTIITSSQISTFEYK